MSGHLGETEFVDLLDRTLPPERLQHLEACATCRNQADALRVSMSAAAEDRLSEPSPLFWEHLSARVRAAVAEEPAPSIGWRARLAPAARWAAVAAAAAGFVVALALWRADLPSAPVSIDQPDLAVQHAPSSGPADPLFGDIDADEAWAIVRTVTDQLEEDDINAAGMGSRPGSAEYIASALSDAERVELAALIEHEIKMLRGPVPSS